MTKWKHARSRAIEAHGDQLYGDKPYVTHLDEVATVTHTHLRVAVSSEWQPDEATLHLPTEAQQALEAHLRDAIQILVAHAVHPAQAVGYMVGYSLSLLAGSIGLLSWGDDRIAILTMRIAARAIEELQTGKKWEP